MSDLLPRPEPREPFKRALRSQLMAQATTALVRRETAWSRFQRGLLRPAVAFAVIALILVGGAGKAAADSLAGDPAFSLKTAAEELHLVLAFDDATRLTLLSELADHRLAEVSRAITTRPSAARVATNAYAIAVARLTAAVDAVRGRPGASADTRSAAEDVVDAAHLKHGAVLDELEPSKPDRSSGATGGTGTIEADEAAEARDGLERAKVEAEKLHASDRPARTPEPAQRSDPTRTPQPTRTAPRPSPTR